MSKLLSMANNVMYPRTPEVTEQSRRLYAALQKAGIEGAALNEIDGEVGALESCCNSVGYIEGFRAAMQIAAECWGNCNREGGEA